MISEGFSSLNGSVTLCEEGRMAGADKAGV